MVITNDGKRVKERSVQNCSQGMFDMASQQSSVYYVVWAFSILRDCKNFTDGSFAALQITLHHLTLSNTLKACLMSSAVSLSLSLFTIRLQNSLQQQISYFHFRQLLSIVLHYSRSTKDTHRLCGWILVDIYFRIL